MVVRIRISLEGDEREHGDQPRTKEKRGRQLKKEERKIKSEKVQTEYVPWCHVGVFFVVDSPSGNIGKTTGAEVEAERFVVGLMAGLPPSLGVIVVVIFADMVEPFYRMVCCLCMCVRVVVW